MKTGCVHHSDCLTCPFAYCLIGRVRSTLRQSRCEQAIRLLRKGKSTEEIAKALHCSYRTIERYLSVKA